MYKESLFFYLFRLLILCSLLAFMAMLYWSSLLVEEDLQKVQGDLKVIKEQIEYLKKEPQRTAEKSPSNDQMVEKSSARPHMKAEFPNILTEDAFYIKTLPAMLGPDFVPHGTRRQSSLGKPENLHPFSGWAQVQDWISYCTLTLTRYETGKYETYAPNMAIKIEARPVAGSDSPEYWIHLREDVFWQPLSPAWFPSNVQLADHFLTKHQVTAHDFKLYYDAVMNPFITEAMAVTLRTYYHDLEEFRVVDDLTFVVRWKSYPTKGEDGKIRRLNKYGAKNLTGSLQPLASFIYLYFSDGNKIVEGDEDPNTYRTNSIWAQNFASHFAKNIIPSCGPWIFSGMTERVIRFRRNPDHFFPLDALASNLEVEIKESSDNAWQSFKSGGLDFYALQPDQQLEFKDFIASPAYQEQEKNGLKINQLEYLARSYLYIGWNEARPLFASKKVRQAMTYAIDRKRIIKQFLSELGIEITGTFYRYSPDYDPTIVPLEFDPERAKRLLEEEGWFDTEGDGIIKKTIDGKRVPFTFELTFYAKNALIKSIADYAVTMLKEVGIQVNLKGVDIADMSSIFDDKNFDAYILAWTFSDPPEDPRQIWHSAGAKEKGSSNSIGFANAEIDWLIDQLTYEYDPQKRIAYFHRFDKILYEAMPYTFLFTSKVLFLYREYLQGVFIPAERQDLIPGANIAEPQQNLFWLAR